MSDKRNEPAAKAAQQLTHASHEDIARCPNPECRSSEMLMDTAMSGIFHWVACPICDYAGPRVPIMADAIRLHNCICVAPDDGKQAATCPRCEHLHKVYEDALRYIECSLEAIAGQVKKRTGT